MNDERVLRCYFLISHGIFVPWADQRYGQIAYKAFFEVNKRNPTFKKSLTYVEAVNLFDK